MSDTDDTLNLIAAANAVIKKVQDEHRYIDDIYRSQNLDPEKVRTVLDKALTPEARAQVQADFEAIMADIEQEVTEETARRSFQTCTEQRPNWSDITRMA